MPKSKRKRRSTNASGYIGVYLNGKRYQALIYKDSKLKGLGTHNTAKQAAKEYDAAAIEAGKPLSKLNFPKKVPPGYTPTNNGQRSNNTSGYRGVSGGSNKGKRVYIARIYAEGNNKGLGTYATAKEAARAYDQAVLKYKKNYTFLNFPRQNYD